MIPRPTRFRRRAPLKGAGYVHSRLAEYYSGRCAHALEHLAELDEVAAKPVRLRGNRKPVLAFSLDSLKEILK